MWKVLERCWCRSILKEISWTGLQSSGLYFHTLLVVHTVSIIRGLGFLLGGGAGYVCVSDQYALELLESTATYRPMEIRYHPLDSLS